MHGPHAPVPIPENQPPAEVGEWEMLDARFAGSPTHVALLHTGEVFAYGGSSLDEEAFANPPPAELLDLATMQVSTIQMDGAEGDFWCGGHTFLEDGRLLLAGGTGYYPRIAGLYGGLDRACIYSPESRSWTSAGTMCVGRWYPTLLRLPDNSVMSIAGLGARFPEFWVRLQESYRPDQGWTPLPQKKLFPLYPRLHLLPDGNVFYSGVYNTHFFIPWAFPSSIWEAGTGRWRPLGGKHVDPRREEGISVLLGLRPPDYRAEVLIAGGGHHNKNRMLLEVLKTLGATRYLSNRPLHHANASVERIDLSLEEPAWEADSAMQSARIHGVGVLLPDGSVLAVGGMASHNHYITKEDFEDQNLADRIGVLRAELYDPRTKTWSWMAAQVRPRLYHSTAILLPDGRVISMGGNPYARIIEPTIEIFSPPYLFRGERPVVLDLPPQITYEEPFSAQVDQASAVSQVVLMRPEVLTHVTNTDQRLLELEFRRLSDERLEISGPLNRNHMPQGYCLLFLLNQEGVPSEGKFVRLV